MTGYWEVLALTHDPRISSDIGRSPLGAALAAGPVPDSGARGGPVYEQVPSIIVTDPPEHDRARQQVMRHFGPPHAPDVIPGTEPGVVRLCNELLDGIAADGRTRLDVVDDYAYPVPVTVICEILGIPIADEPTFHVWIHDMPTGTDLGPDASTAEGKIRAEKARGGPLARLEVNLALETFVQRVAAPGLVVDPPPYRRSQIFRGPRHLLVQFDHLAEQDDSGSWQTAETARG